MLPPERTFQDKGFKSFILPLLMPRSPLNSLYPAKQYIFYLCRSHFVHNLFFVFSDCWQCLNTFYIGSHLAVITLIWWPTQHLKCKIVGQSQLDFCKLFPYVMPKKDCHLTDLPLFLLSWLVLSRYIRKRRIFSKLLGFAKKEHVCRCLVVCIRISIYISKIYNTWSQLLRTAVVGWVFSSSNFNL